MTMSSTTRLTREDWLNRAVKLLRPICTQHNIVVPATVHVSIGWPSRLALSRRRPRIGECWHGEHTKDKHPQLFISPVLNDSVRVLDVLLHELLHTALPVKTAHGSAFAKAARAVGLEGKPTATVAGKELRERLVAMVEKLGELPHVGLTATSKRKVQSTRLLKACCSAGDCGYIIRVTRRWVDEAGLPTCPCGHDFELT